MSRPQGSPGAVSARPTVTGLVLDRPKSPPASLPAPDPAVEPAEVDPNARSDEVQALRAVAVTLVVLYHAWPSAVPGGYVGVDVFFVVSGFLITTLLVREIEQTGTVSVTRFWARRARRILPAALLTLLVCALATITLLPVTAWDQAFTELRASAAYVQNLHLAAAAVDYAAADDGPSI